MIDRQMLGDVGLAVLLVLPSAALARPEPAASDNNARSAPIVEKVAVAERGSLDRRFSLRS